MAIRIHLTPQDVARVGVAPRPAPLQELNVALAMMCRRDGDLLHGPWRRRALRALPGAAHPLADLVPAGRAPGFLDVTADSVPAALEQVRATPAEVVAAELERVHAPARTPVPAWVQGLRRGDARAWQVVHRAQLAAFEALLAPVWGQVQDLHRGEFVRRAVELAEGGVGALLSGLLPGARLHGGVWELPGPPREVRPGGRGLLLLPTFHWSGGPLLSDLPGRPVVVTYPAGPGLPPRPDGATGPQALAKVVGGTRAELLRLLTEARTTTELARRLRVSAPTVSAHAAALRGAGLLSTERAGKAVLHRRTALGSLLLGQGPEVRPESG
ncbi:winged helix-turn-helix domain-containing protein [Streptomyces antimicrobicus]|uniref:Winged helix-turn-helix domain-containing protein n=1 Tax=Streptomyces antimicrobicus TaxID=2883108 RepID=A0ABS8B507_9ACTN|nr:winged helix-turn-helix domain-containing protein [Streptomyces antimicrobicus]MCB5179696.1 winged helix-turn-helix domain-containing protein [Streptomyces antimicrobicus]